MRVVEGGAWTGQAVRDELDRVEEAAWSVRGGGTNAFRHNLEEAARAIVGAERLPVVVDALDAIVREMPSPRPSRSPAWRRRSRCSARGMCWGS